jgi:hypothetical protein
MDSKAEFHLAPQSWRHASIAEVAEDLSDVQSVGDFGTVHGSAPNLEFVDTVVGVK